MDLLVLLVTYISNQLNRSEACQTDIKIPKTFLPYGSQITGVFYALISDTIMTLKDGSRRVLFTTRVTG